jgi:hypothetical protein
MHYSDCFDENLDEIPHYLSYPRMRPFVGTEYGRGGPKILLVAESHYLPPASTVHLDAARWYAGSESDLCPEKERGWINTREIVNKGRWVKKGHTIYRHVALALEEAGIPASNNAFRYVAFMNCFQRPAVSKQSISATPLDLEVAVQTVSAVIEVLAPDHVVFISTKAKDKVGKRMALPSYSIPHPACPWWHRASKKGTGKDQFVRLVSGLIR